MSGHEVHYWIRSPLEIPRDWAIQPRPVSVQPWNSAASGSPLKFSLRDLPWVERQSQKNFYIFGHNLLTMSHAVAENMVCRSGISLDEFPVCPMRWDWHGASVVKSNLDVSVGNSLPRIMNPTTIVEGANGRLRPSRLGRPDKLIQE